MTIKNFEKMNKFHQAHDLLGNINQMKQNSLKRYVDVQMQ